MSKWVFNDGYFTREDCFFVIKVDLNKYQLCNWDNVPVGKTVRTLGHAKRKAKKLSKEIETMKLNTLKTKLKFVSKNVRPILVNVKVNVDSIECTDLETFVKIKNNHDMLPGLQRYDTLGLVESTTKDVDDYPLTDFELDPVDTIETSIEILEDLNKYASKDETRPHLNGVAVDCTHLVATDGHVLKTFALDSEIDNTYILPRESIINLIKLLKGYKVRNPITIKLNEEYAVIDNDFFTLKMRLINRDYVKWQGIIPRKFEHSFNVTDWINLKEIKALFDKNGGCRIVCIGGDVVLIPAKYPDNQYVIGQSDLDFELGFNVNFLDLALKNGKVQSVFKFNNEISPAMVNGAIVMPLRL